MWLHSEKLMQHFLLSFSSFYLSKYKFNTTQSSFYLLNNNLNVLEQWVQSEYVYLLEKLTLSTNTLVQTTEFAISVTI